MTQGRGYMVLVSLIVALGGLLLGFDSAVISGAVPFIETHFALSEQPLLLGFGVGSLILGAMAGNAVAGPLSDRFGRKKVLILTSLLFLVSALGSALAPTFSVFVGSRILCGVAVGMAILIAPVYIAEISPPRWRGSLVSFNQLNIVIGISASYFSNYFLLRRDLGPECWRWMLAMEAVPAVAYFVLLFLVPESPRWLFGQGREKEARDIFIRATGAEQLEEELQRIRESFAKTEAGAGLGALFSWRMSFIIFIALGLAFFQQITGINAILYYATAIFSKTGSGQDAAFMQAAIVGVVNLGMTLVAIWLIDRLGRKPLLAIGSFGMAVSLLVCSWAFHASSYQLTPKSFELLQTSKLPEQLVADLKELPQTVYARDTEFLASLEKSLGTDRIKAHREALTNAALNIRAYVVLVAILGFVGSFAISLGPVMWAMLSEIFPNNLRGVAISFVGFCNSVVSFIVTLVFPWEMSTLGPAGTYLVYGLLASASLVFVLLFVPETKGKSLEELEGLLLRDDNVARV